MKLRPLSLILCGLLSAGSAFPVLSADAPPHSPLMAQINNGNWLALSVALSLTCAQAYAQSAPLTITHPQKPDLLNQLSPDVTMPEAYVKAIAQQAFIWGIPSLTSLTAE